jgi:hypothetical protein
MVKWKEHEKKWHYTGRIRGGCTSKQTKQPLRALKMLCGLILLSFVEDTA